MAVMGIIGRRSQNLGILQAGSQGSGILCFAQARSGGADRLPPGFNWWIARAAKDSGHSGGLLSPPQTVGLGASRQIRHSSEIR